jgi:hypothetical protein
MVFEDIGFQMIARNRKCEFRAFRAIPIREYECSVAQLDPKA